MFENNIYVNLHEANTIKIFEAQMRKKEKCRQFYEHRTNCYMKKIKIILKSL